MKMNLKCKMKKLWLVFVVYFKFYFVVLIVSMRSSHRKITCLVYVWKLMCHPSRKTSIYFDKLCKINKTLMVVIKVYWNWKINIDIFCTNSMQPIFLYKLTAGHIIVKIEIRVLRKRRIFFEVLKVIDWKNKILVFKLMFN